MADSDAALLRDAERLEDEVNSLLVALTKTARRSGRGGLGRAQHLAEVEQLVVDAAVLQIKLARLAEVSRELYRRANISAVH